MKIAIPITSNNQVDSHFGHAEKFRIYTIAENKIIEDRIDVKSAEGCGCKSNIAGVLATHGVKTLLVGGVGDGAIRVLNNVGIEVVRGCEGDAENIAKDFAAGKISDGGSSCNHHLHGGEGCQHH